MVADFYRIASEGTRREALQAIRERLAGELVLAEGRDVAPIARQLAEVIREIDSLPLPEGVSTLDELRQRTARLTAPEDMPRTELPAQPRT